VLYYKFISSSIIIISRLSPLININKADHQCKKRSKIGFCFEMGIKGAAKEQSWNSRKLTEMQQQKIKINQKSQILHNFKDFMECAFFTEDGQFHRTCNSHKI